jgi:hypothetical protein
MSITVNTTGKLFRDDFNRGDSGVVGGTPAWTENDASYEINTNQLYDNQATWNNVFMYQTTGLPAVKHGFCIQANYKSVASRFHGVGAFNDVAQADSSIYAGFSSGGNWEVTRIEGGVNQAQDLDTTLDATAGEWYGVRMMVTQNGSNVDVSCLATTKLDDNDDLSKAFAETGAALTNQPYPTSGVFHGPVKWNSDQWMDEYIVMGNETGGAITMDGLPTGYKLQIDSNTAVAESGGTATIPMSTWKTYPFPSTTVKVLDDGDSLVESKTTAVYGGATMTYTAPVGGLHTFDYRATVYDPSVAAETTVLTPRAGAAHSDDFIVSTVVVSGAKEYLERIKGRRGKLDVLSKRTDTGQISLRVMDAKTGTSNAQRWVTAFIGDAANIDQLVGAKVLIEESTDGGTTWSDFYTGRIQKVGLKGKLWVDLQINDMAQDLDYTIFTGNLFDDELNEKRLAAPSTLAGDGSRPGLVPRSLFDRANHLGGTAGYGSYVTSPWVKGDIDANGLLQVDHSTEVPEELRRMDEAWPEATTPAHYNGQYITSQENKRIRVRVRNSGGTIKEFNLGARRLGGLADVLSGTISQFFNEGPTSVLVNKLQLRALDNTDDPDYALLTAFLSESVHFVIYSVADPTDAAPILITDEHPVQVLADILDGYYGPLDTDGTPIRAFPYDSTSFAALIADLTIPKGRWVIEETAKLNEWIEENIMVPYNLGYRLNAAGEMVIFDLRRPTSATVASVDTITEDDLEAGKDSVWVHNRKGAITDLKISYKAETGLPQVDLSGWEKLAAILGVEANIKPYILPVYTDTHSIRWLASNQLATKGTQGHEIEHPGTFGRLTLAQVILQFINNEPFLRSFLERMKDTFFGYFSAGPVTYSLECNRWSTNADAFPGDWRIVNVPWLPNTSTSERGGARVALCIGRAEDGARIRLDFLDAGRNSVATSPALNALALTSGDEEHSVDVSIDFTMFSVSTKVVVEYAVTDSTTAAVGNVPDSYWLRAFGHAAFGGTVGRAISDLPAGRRIWVRARTEPTENEILPSPWVYPSGADYIDLTAYTAPNTLAADVASYGGGVVGLSWAAGETELDTVLELAESTCPAGSYTRVGRIPAGSLTYILAGLEVSTTYCARIYHIDRMGGQTSAVTVQFTTGATKNTAPAMGDLVVVLSET